MAVHFHNFNSYWCGFIRELQLIPWKGFHHIDITDWKTVSCKHGSLSAARIPVQQHGNLNSTPLSYSSTWSVWCHRFEHNTMTKNKRVLNSMFHSYFDKRSMGKRSTMDHFKSWGYSQSTRVDCTIGPESSKQENFTASEGNHPSGPGQKEVKA